MIRWDFGGSGQNPIVQHLSLFSATWKAARKVMYFPSNFLFKNSAVNTCFQKENTRTTFHQDVQTCPNKHPKMSKRLYNCSIIAYMSLCFPELFPWSRFFSIQHPTGHQTAWHLEKELIMGRGRDPSLPWKVWRSTSSWRASKNLGKQCYAELLNGKSVSAWFIGGVSRLFRLQVKNEES